MRHPIRYRLEWLALIALRVIARILPTNAADRCGAAFGQLIGKLWGRRARIARDNLRRAFPDWSEGQIRAVSSAVFANFGRTTFEILRITPSTPQFLETAVEAPTMDFMEDARRGDKGAILMSGHIGNWELLAGYLRDRGYPIDVVVKPMRNPLSDRFYNLRRNDLQLGIIHTQTGTRGIIQALRDKHLVAILADQYAGEDGVEVTFFGRKVSTPRGPAVLAIKYGCPIITGIMIRIAPGRYRVDIDGPLTYTLTGDDEVDVIAITQEFTSRLENHIRKYPDQWLWTHRRWRD
jgi:KDO2-lipid IV(A) lauroyltransferase